MNQSMFIIEYLSAKHSLYRATHEERDWKDDMKILKYNNGSSKLSILPCVLSSNDLMMRERKKKVFAVSWNHEFIGKDHKIPHSRLHKVSSFLGNPVTVHYML